MKQTRKEEYGMIAHKIRQCCAENPGASAKEIAEILNYSAKTVRNNIVREEKRTLLGKGLTIDYNTNISEYDALNHFSIQSNVRSYLIDTYKSFGVFCAYLLSNEGSEYTSVGQLVLSACHPKSERQILLGRRPAKVRSSEFLSLLNSARPFLLDILPPIPKKKARSIDLFILPEAVLDRIEALQKEKSPLVNVFSGRPFKDIRVPKQCAEVSIEKIRKGLIDQSLDYSLLIEQNLPYAQAALELLRTDQSRFVLSQGLMKKVMASPQPAYSGKVRTTRIYPQGPNWLSLRREIRTGFFHGFEQFDLKHAQFSIAAILWNDPDLKARATHGNLWAELVQNTGLPKQAVKTMLYALLFGGTLGNAMHAVIEKDSSFSFDQLKKAMIGDPLFAQIYRASRAYSEEIQSKRSCIDAFKNELYPKGRKANEGDLKSMKAVQAQSFEIAIMTPMVQYLLEQKVPIWLFLHDGVILEPGSHVYFEECSRIVRDKADSLGIEIRLTQEVLKGTLPKPPKPIFLGPWRSTGHT